MWQAYALTQMVQVDTDESYEWEEQLVSVHRSESLGMAAMAELAQGSYDGQEYLLREHAGPNRWGKIIAQRYVGPEQMLLTETQWTALSDLRNARIAQLPVMPVSVSATRGCDLVSLLARG